MADITTLSRDELARRWRRDYKFRIPSADVEEGTEQHALSLTVADQMLVMMANAEKLGRGPLVRQMTGKRLLDYAVERGITDAPLPATGASGYVDITTATGGATIFADDEAVSEDGLRFKCIATDLYTSSTPVPVVGIDTGTDTNLEAGAKLTWTNPRPGCAATCTVAEDSDGAGLTGGHAEETETEIQDRILEQEADPPAAGNVAAYIKATRATPSVPVEQVFVYPAILGPGTMCVCFTVRTATESGSRLSTAVQEGLVEAHLKGVMPEDDGVFVAAMLASSVAVAVEVDWRTGVSGFVDAAPWPEGIAGDFVKVNAGATPSATSFRLTTATSTTTPQVGQTVAFYDATARKFRAKRILTVTVIVSAKSWDITVDTTAGASDLSFVPAVGAMASPYAAALDSLGEKLRLHFRTLGPGEQVASFSDDGIRQRRSPRSPEKWPHRLTELGLSDSIRTLVRDANVLAPTLPYATPTGTAGTLSYLLEMGDLAAFKQ